MSRQAGESTVAKPHAFAGNCKGFFKPHIHSKHNKAFRIMKSFLLLLWLLPTLVFAQGPAPQPTEAEKRYQEIVNLQWQHGPSKVNIGSNASIEIPKNHAFLDAANTRKFLELNGNPPQDNNYTIAPDSLEWFAILEFADTGYITDDDKIDPDALMKAFKEGDDASNKQRKKLNMEAIYTDGWAVPPHYDDKTKQLEWGIQLHSDSGHKNVNYTSRILGREGFMNAILVADDDMLDQNITSFKHALAGFSYNPGKTYAEFLPGDKVAGYGLTGLILGGAAAVATKKGFWAAIAGAAAAFWKVIVAAVIAALAGIASIFKKKQ
ncbi:DUF2167 domain-containing protein [Comamonas terrigena]|uniref:DUF2167 domain-containing protein n=1 Tax=Comamonas terrigena TaxID=32013 RepID=UPI00289F8D9D|nr:DUF2167 domain-containing protein [Comamonas terrigena]